MFCNISDYMTQTESLTLLIRKYMEFLVDRKDPDFGVLDVLIVSKDLTLREFHQIRSQPSTIGDRNRKLLHYVIEKNKPDMLIPALEKAKQKHLVNYLNSDGSKFTCVQQVYVCDSHDCQLDHTKHLHVLLSMLGKLLVHLVLLNIGSGFQI